MNSKYKNISEVWSEVKRVYTLNMRNIIYAYKDARTFLEINTFYENLHTECRFIFLTHASDKFYKDTILPNYRSLAEKGKILILSLSVLRTDPNVEKLAFDQFQQMVLSKLETSKTIDGDLDGYDEDDTIVADVESKDEIEESIVNRLKDQEAERNKQVAIEEDDSFVDNFIDICNSYGGEKRIYFLFFHKLICYIRPYYIVNNINFSLHKSFRIVHKSYVTKLL